jgi:3-oxoacyl-[acyl-carrier protein] reductase
MVQDQVVLVTGAARGIGRYIAHTFAQAGARLVVADIRPLNQLCGELRDIGAAPLAVTADVSDEDAVRSMMRTVVDELGQIDVLVNNAAIPTHSSWEPIWPRVRDMDKTFWDRIIDVNLGGTFLCTKHVLPYMEERRSGHILNLYGGGNVKAVGACVYVTSKEAVRCFTRYVAEEEREWNICILVLTPGGEIATEDAPADVRQRLPGVELVSNRFVLAAQAGMELSGQCLILKDGRLEAIP